MTRNIEDKIKSYLEENYSKQEETEISKIGETKNKNNNTLYYVRRTQFNSRLLNNLYFHKAIYLGFNDNGDYVCTVTIESPMDYSTDMDYSTNRVEMEYYCDINYQNQGNITSLARKALDDIFINKLFDGLNTRFTNKKSSINQVVVKIRPDNYPSLRVAEKLGFSNEGILTKDKYLGSNNYIISDLDKKIALESFELFYGRKPNFKNKDDVRKLTLALYILNDYGIYLYGFSLEGIYPSYTIDDEGYVYSQLIEELANDISSNPVTENYDVDSIDKIQIIKDFIKRVKLAKETIAENGNTNLEDAKGTQELWMQIRKTPGVYTMKRTLE